MRRRKRPSWLPLLPFFGLVPSAAPRPVSLVHQEPETAPIRKSPTEGSAFAREAASAVAAAAAAATVVDQDDANPDAEALHSTSPARALHIAEIDASLGVLVAGEGISQSQSQRNLALAVVGERAKLMIAGTVDGQVHALDPATGDLRWSFSTGEPLVKSFQQLPGALDEKRWLIPTLDGSMLVHTAQGLRRPGLNARLLVEQTPFLAPGGTFYTGSKVSRIFGVDACTGEVRQVLSGDTADSLESNRRLLAQSGSDDNVIWIGRNDYTVRAFDVPTGQEEWNLTIGEFVSLDGLYLATSSAASGGVNGGTRTPATGHGDPTPILVATPDGSLRLKASSGKVPKPVTGFRRTSSEWDVPLPGHVASVFGVTLEEGSSHTYLPLQQLPLMQSAGDGLAGVSSGSGGTAAVGMLENGQAYAVALDEHDSDAEEGGDFGGGGAGGGRSAGGGGSRSGKKNRPGEVKVTHGGRATATQPLLPHGDWQRDNGDGADHGGMDGGGHGISGALVQSLSPKGSSRQVSGPPRWCQPGHSSFPNCLSGVHTVQHIGGEEQARLSLGMGSHAGALDGGAGGGSGTRDPKGVRSSTGYVSRLPPLYGTGLSPGRGMDDDGSGLAGMISGLGMGPMDGNYLDSDRAPQGPLEALLGWLYRGWSIVSLGLLAVVVMVVVDSRRAAKLFKQVGLGGYPLYANGGPGGEYDPTADSGFSGASEASASTAGAGGAVVVAGGVKGELRVGCLTVSDTVLGYGSHGTVVYRGLLEGRPVAVKRMLTDFHARADREISLLIESDGHPNVVRYFVREEAGEFVYLALQLCQLSLHNAMAQIHAAMAQARRKVELENGGKSSAPRVGLSQTLTKDDVTAPPELRAALLQVIQGVEHLHSLRIVHRDLKPHNILLAAKDQKGPGLGRKPGTSSVAAGGTLVKGSGEGEQETPRKLIGMRDVACFVLKISDMGLGKQLLNGQSSFGMSSYGRMPGGRDQGQGGDPLARARASNAQASSSAGGHVGSIGWQAPEVIADRVSLEGGQGPSGAGGTESSPPSSTGASSWATAGGSSSSSSRRTQAVDVFSLGCIFHHCIVPGSHPFGQWYEREANIIQDKASRLEELAHIPDAHDLVSLMTAREPDLRPSAAEACKHPFFWNDEKRLSFLLEFSDRLEQDAVQSPLLVMIEAGADSVVGRSWDVRLDPELTEDAGRYRKYDFSSVRDLLRVVRNKRHHFHELPERVQGLMSPLPGGFLRYVEERFPQLLMHCTKVTGALLSDERLFREYLVPFLRALPPSAIASSAQSNSPEALPLATPTVTVSAEADRPTDNRPEAPMSPTLAPASNTPATAAAATQAADVSTPLPPRASKLPDVPAEEGLTAEDGGTAEGPGSAAARANGAGPSPKDSEARSSGSLSDGRPGSASPGKKPGSTTPRSSTPRSGRKSYGGVEVGPDGVATGGPVRVTEQNGPRGEGALQDVLLWNESAVAKSMGCRGWWRHQDHWQRRLDVTKQRPRGAHLNKALQDPKYRTRLCSHWESSKGMLCPMRRRGAGKCDFAHGGIELRVRANKRDRWGRHTGSDGASGNLDASGGEDTLGAARSIGRIRIENGEKDGAGSAAVAGGRGSGGAGGVAGAGGGGARQGKRAKGGGVQGVDGGGYQARPRVGVGAMGDPKMPPLNGGGAPQGGANGSNRSPQGRGAWTEQRGEANGEASPHGGPPPAFVTNGGAPRPPQPPQPGGMRNEGFYRAQSQQSSSRAIAADRPRDSRVDAVARLVATVGHPDGVVANGEPSQEHQSRDHAGRSPVQRTVLARPNEWMADGAAASERP